MIGWDACLFPPSLATRKYGGSRHEREWKGGEEKEKKKERFDSIHDDSTSLQLKAVFPLGINN